MKSIRRFRLSYRASRCATLGNNLHIWGRSRVSRRDIRLREYRSRCAGFIAGICTAEITWLLPALVGSSSNVTSMFDGHKRRIPTHIQQRHME
ncbi:hypothetical protein P8C59_008759 [Phyllachora maydis]|uniref:Uncharacterized protein n=1 Tax=Phyllachora maydis TaxID=1825666 RepID=A0AAD9IBS4_9PEZI|nr:hypothetical protein P8C59_008759 [Phyllachora maydis]